MAVVDTDDLTPRTPIGPPRPQPPAVPPAPGESAGPSPPPAQTSPGAQAQPQPVQPQPASEPQQQHAQPQPAAQPHPAQPQPANQPQAVLLALARRERERTELELSESAFEPPTPWTHTTVAQQLERLSRGETQLHTIQPQPVIQPARTLPIKPTHVDDTVWTQTVRVPGSASPQPTFPTRHVAAADVLPRAHLRAPLTPTSEQTARSTAHGPASLSVAAIRSIELNRAAILRSAARAHPSAALTNLLKPQAGTMDAFERPGRIGPSRHVPDEPSGSRRARPSKAHGFLHWIGHEIREGEGLARHEIHRGERLIVNEAHQAMHEAKKLEHGMLRLGRRGEQFVARHRRDILYAALPEAKGADWLYRHNRPTRVLVDETVKHSAQLSFALNTFAVLTTPIPGLGEVAIALAMTADVLSIVAAAKAAHEKKYREMLFDIVAVGLSQGGAEYARQVEKFLALRQAKNLSEYSKLATEYAKLERTQRQEEELLTKRIQSQIERARGHGRSATEARKEIEKATVRLTFLVALTGLAAELFAGNKDPRRSTRR